MKYKITVDDKTTAGKRIMEIAVKARKGVEIENPAINGVPPEGYMTGDEFVRSILERLQQKYKDHGLL